MFEDFCNWIVSWAWPPVVNSWNWFNSQNTSFKVWVPMAILAVLSIILVVWTTGFWISCGLLFWYIKDGHDDFVAWIRETLPWLAEFVNYVFNVMDQFFR